ncbi:MAG: hypothetical protein ACI4CC_02375 [Lachnospiraceae bacterium]
MGLFHFFRRKRGQKKLDEVVERYESEVLLEDQKKDAAQVKRYLIEQCEEMAKEATDMAAAKQEYQSVTSYLTDIQLIESMEQQDRDKLTDTAMNIMNLTQARADMQRKAARIPDPVYNQLDMMKEEVPKAIVRLKENEKRQSVMKRDLDYLEGEKVEWTYEKAAIRDEQKICKRVSTVIFSLEAICVAVFLSLILTDKQEYTSAILIVMLVVAVILCLVLLRIQNNKRDLKQCSVNYNKAVSIQNSIKLKYINIANAVDYAHEKYHVTSGEELEKQWQIYLETVKEREKLEQAQDDLNYYSGALIRLLRRYDLYDAGIWVYQAAALVDRKEMVEVKHALLERRNKIWTKIEGERASILTARSEILSLASQQNMMTAEMRGILDVVDKIVS